MEIWKDIKGYEGYYQVSNLGRVKSLERKVWNGKCFYTKKSKIIKFGNDGHGYLRVVLCVNKIKKDFKIHRLVAEAFIPNIDNKPCVNHIDCNKHNNNIENLEWCTYKENMKHAYKNKLYKTVSVNMYDLNMKYLMSFNSYKEAYLWLQKNGYPKASYQNIAKCIKNKRTQAYNYKWKLKE